MSREEMLRAKRFPRWLAAVLIAFAGLGGVACEATVEDDDGGGVEVEDEGGNGDEGGVDTDVDVDADSEGGEGGDAEETGDE